MHDSEPMQENICLSGGADGADLQWGMCAGKAGHQVIHWSYGGHRTAAPPQEVVRLSEEQLSIADPHLVKANATVKRHLPFKKPWIINLLRRNYYQVAEAGSMYAVSNISNGQVEGGTAWAVAMFNDLHPDSPCYVYDQKTSNWYSWQDSAWVQIDSPPTPTGIWAGVGSRELTPSGKNAIRTLMGYQS